jgi:hypothetical protein
MCSAPNQVARVETWPSWQRERRSAITASINISLLAEGGRSAITASINISLLTEGDAPRFSWILFQITRNATLCDQLTFSLIGTSTRWPSSVSMSTTPEYAPGFGGFAGSIVILIR